MTFEELKQITIEQATRTLALNCSFKYTPKKNFTSYHFKELKQNYIRNACWEVLNQLEFPFEQIIPNIEFVYTVSDVSETTKILAGISFQFSLYILNYPHTTVHDLSRLALDFTTLFDDVLTRMFNIPMEIKSSSSLLEIHHAHSLFYAASNDKSF